MAIFSDWRGLDCSSQNIILDSNKIYYWHGKAHGFKGLVGGTHGHISFFDKRWYTVEITDEETLEYQNCEIVFRNTNEYQKRDIFISTRKPDQFWFGNVTKIVDECERKISLSDVVLACKRYPSKEFDILKYNCNTFVSFLIYELNLSLRRPFISVGYKSRKYWNTCFIPSVAQSG